MRSLLPIVCVVAGLSLHACDPQGVNLPGALPTGDSTQTGIDPLFNLVSEAARDFEELSRPRTLRCWVDQLKFKSQPGEDFPELDKLGQGEILTYLYQRTYRKFNYTLREQHYHEPWLLVRRANGQVGWVFGGGVVFVRNPIESAPAESAPAGQTSRGIDPSARRVDPSFTDSFGTTPDSPPPSGTGEVTSYAIEPGKRIGQIRLNTSEADLVRVFGPTDVSRGSIAVSNRKNENCTVLFPDTRNELRITWQDASKREQVKAVYVMRPGSQWYLPGGAYVGMPLAEFTKVNRAPISFYGFNWEYSGVIESYQKGRFAPVNKLFYAALAPHQPRLVDPEILNSFNGNEVFTSNTPNVDQLDLRIARIVVYLD